MRAWPALSVILTVAAVASLAAAGCKEKNPLYCANATDPRCAGGPMDGAAGDGPHDGVADAPGGCTGDPDCATVAGRPACDTTTHACVACTRSKDHCSGATPICSDAACRACKTDQECVTAISVDPGVCMPDGHCAMDAEVLYAVAPPVGDCGTADGTLAKPFCTADGAVHAASIGAKSIVVLRGEFGTISVPSTAATLTVVGQGDASINPGGNIYGIDVGATAPAIASLSVRNVTITGGTATAGAVAAHVAGSGASLTLTSVQMDGNAGGGVLAENGAHLTMDACIVKGNGGLSPPALKVTGAAFDITNSVFANSNIGATLDMVAATGDRVFKNNTIVGNGSGIVCTGPAPANASPSGLILFGNTTDNLGCTVAACCTGDPLLTADYHLMSGSPCIDQLTADPQVTTDLDGQARPQGPKSDCGADELVPN